jgi:two-component system sensor histidine kinase PilS (NtrC family)
MRDHLLQKEDSARRVRRLIFFRVAIVTVLFGIVAFIQIKGAESLPEASVTSAYFIIIITYLLSFLYLLIVKRIKNLEANVYIQAICDVTLITILVYVTGGVESVYSVLYPLVIIYSALFLAKKGGVIIASASSILYGLLLDLEYYSVIHPIHSPSWDYGFSAGYTLSRIFIHIVSFYIVALLISFVVEQEKSARSLLAEKESEFHQLDLLHRSIIESVGAGIITINLQGNIKSFNRAAREITGFSFSKVKNKKIDNVFPEFSEILEMIKNEKRDEGRINRNEILVSGKDNKSIVLGFSMSPLIDSKDRKIGEIVIFQDLTASKEMEREVEKSKSLALIGEMAAGLAHEIRNPLASLCGSIQMLQKNLELDKTDERLMRIVLRGRDQLENLVRNFLLLARPNLDGRQELNIKYLMDDVLESLRHSPDWHENIKVVMALSDQTSIYGNMTEIKQALWNLVLNAVQSMSNSGRLKIETRPVIFDNWKEYLEIRISDNGCGIEKDDSNKIFEPFYTTKERGTGLGLAIVNRIVESHGGKIRIESELEKGTGCILLLPRNKGAGESRIANG